MDSNKRKAVIKKSVFAGLSAVAGVLVLTLLQNTWTALYWSAAGVSFALAAAIVFVKSKKHPFIFKLLIIASVVLIIYVITHIILHHTGASGYLLRLRSIDEVRNLILTTGNWGLVIFFLLTLLQVIVLPIPAAVTVAAGAMVYGTFVSFIVSTVGTILGSIVCFYLGRIFGKKLIVWLIGDEKTEKYSALIAEKGKGVFVGMMLFPFFPDDILCMTAGLSKMSFRFFIISISLTRPVMLAVYSFLGSDEILGYDLAGILIRIGILAACLVFMFIFQIAYKKITAHLEARKESDAKAEGKKSGTKNPAPALEAADDMTAEKPSAHVQGKD